MRFFRPLFLSGLASAHTCEDMCAEVESCATSIHAQGSYCKDWQNPKVCFGLYYTDDTFSTICYQPNDSKCRESYPVACPID